MNEPDVPAPVSVNMDDLLRLPLDARRGNSIVSETISKLTSVEIALQLLWSLPRDGTFAPRRTHRLWLRGGLIKQK